MAEPLQEQVKKIADFWLDSKFLDKFKEIGSTYTKQIKEEKKNGFEQIKGTISCRGY